MMKRKCKAIEFGIFSALVAATLLSGCSSYEGRTQKVTELQYNEYKLYLYEPWQSVYGRFRDQQIERAQQVCRQKGLEMMPLDAVTHEKDKGFEGEILFRCVKRVNGPNLGLF